MKKIILTALFSMILLSFSSLHAQYSQLPGPQGGTVQTFYVDGTTIWVGTERNGIFLSTNDGLSWSPRNQSLEAQAAVTGGGGSSLDVQSITRIGTFLVIATNGQGLYRSSNDGQTWVRVNNGIPATTFNVIRHVMTSGTNLIATTGTNYDDGTYVSVNNGLTWSTAGGLPKYRFYHRPIKIGNTLFLTGANPSVDQPDSVYVSTDDGISWTARNPVSIARNNTGFRNLFFESGVLYASTENNTLPNNSQAVIRSLDTGRTWTAFNTGLFNSIRYRKFSTAAGNLYLTGLNNNSTSTGAGGVYRYNTTSNTWETRNVGLPITEAVTITTTNSGTLLAGVFSAGIYRSTNSGASWIKSDVGFSSTSVLGFAQIGNTLFAATPIMTEIFSSQFSGEGVYRSTDNGTTWTVASLGLPQNFGIRGILAANNVLYANAFGATPSSAAGVYRSDDNGDSWTLGVMPVGFSTSSQARLVATTNAVFMMYPSVLFRSVNAGQTWQTITNTGIATFRGIYANGNTLIVSGTSSRTVRSTDNGNTWNQIADLSDTEYYNFVQVGSVIYAPGSSKLKHSTDDGLTWQLVTNTYPVSLSSKLVASVVNGDTVFFAGSFDSFTSSFYVGTNGGRVWTNRTGEYGNGDARYVYDLWIKDGFLFIGTGGRGVWRGALQNILSVEKISDTHVKTFALEQNYPNPFNPSTIINYKIPMSSDVRLDVFDMLGRKVATLVSERQNAGSYQTTFNAGYFSSGVYFYRLEVRSAGSRAATFNQTKKMLLVK